MKLCRVLLLPMMLLCAMYIGAEEEEDYSDLSLADLLDIPVTTASKTEQSADMAPGIISVITKDDIRASGARSLGDVLNMVPGITVGRSLQNGFNITLYFRGSYSLNGEDVLILKDGKRMNDAYTGGGTTFIPDFPVGNIKQIEIIRGPGSALYGANAFVGVVNIITEQGTDTSYASVRAGDYNGLFAHAYLAHAFNEDSSIHFYVDYANNELEEIPTNRIVEWPVGNLPLPFATNVVYDNRFADDTREMVSAEIFYEYKGFRIGYEYSDSEQFNNWGAGVPLDPITSGGIVVDLSEDRFRNADESEYNSISLTYDGEVNDQFSYHFSLGHNDFYNLTTYQTGANFPFGVRPYLGEGLGAEFHFDRNTTTTFAGLSTEWTPREGHSLVAGVDYQKDEVEDSLVISNFPFFGPVTSLDPLAPNGSRLLPATRTIYAAYAQYTAAVHERATVTVGARYDDYDDFGGTFNPRAALVWSVSDKVNVKALYGQAFRAPSFAEKNQDFVVVRPNAELDPEELKTFEGQLNWKPRPEMAFSLAAFTYEVEDVINQLETNENPAVPSETKFFNIGTRTVDGIEAELRFKNRDGHSFYINYSWADATDEIGGVEFAVEGIPETSINAGFEAVLMKDTLFWSATVVHRADWNSQRPVVFTIPGAGVTVPRFNELEFDDYTLISTRLEYRMGDDLSFNLSVLNIADEQTTFADQHVFTPGGITTERRQFLVGVRKTF